MDFTFLTEEQIFGEERLEVFEKCGAQAVITDFSILLGGFVSSSHFVFEGNSKQYCGCWWTKTPEDDYVVFVDAYSKFGALGGIYDRNIGARPVLSYSSFSDICSKKVKGKNGILEVEYGEYPQTRVSIDFSLTLEQAYTKGIINKTGKGYTTDSVDIKDIEKTFQPKTHIEYEYKGEKYIRLVAENSSFSHLSDGRMVDPGNFYWVKVEPIKWIVDEKADIAFTKKIIFSGVQFYREEFYNGNFKNTDIKKFMDKYFSKEIIPNNILQKDENKALKKYKNPYNLKFNEVSEEDIIRGAIESNVSVFLHGLSADGKSSRVKQIDPTCEILYLCNQTPESLNGKSVYNSNTGEMIDIKPTWLKRIEEKCLKEPEKLHILFFDELTNALPSIQGIAFNIILDKEVNGIWKLPENVRIVAAGNDMKDSLAANQLAEPLFNRFAHVYIKTTLNSWLKWAKENKIHPAIYSYIAYKNGEVLRSEYDGEKPNADPRKWEMASKMLYKTGNPEMLRALVGEDITREFVTFCNQKVIRLQDVINENYNLEEINELNTAEKYATTTGLTLVDIDNVEIVRNFVKILGEEFVSIFDSLWINDNEKLEKIAELKKCDLILTKTTKFIKM